MGQSKWAGACALVVALSIVVGLKADDADQNPFEAEVSPGADVGRQTGQAERRIERALDSPLKSPLQFPETPLNTIMGLISDEYDIPILFDTAALDAVAVSPDQEIDVDIGGVTLRSAVELMLRQIEDLTYIIDKEVLLITTEDEANSRLEVRVYRVDDLWDLSHNAPPKDFKGGSWADFSPLLEVVTSCVEPDSWNENGTGEGEIHQLPPGMLVIYQTAKVHHGVDGLLSQIRRVRQQIKNNGAEAEAMHSSAALAAKEADEDDGR